VRQGTQSARLVDCRTTRNTDWRGSRWTSKSRSHVISGAVQNITDNSAEPRGGFWAPDGTIYYAPHNIAALKKVPTSGGTPVDATQLDRAAGEISHRWPVLR
jgi:hypothetical protein